RSSHPAHTSFPYTPLFRSPQQDHANLIRAFSLLRTRMPDLQLVFAGTDCDDSNAELMRLLQEAGGMENVHLLGRRSDIPALMNADRKSTRLNSSHVKISYA